MSRPLGLCTAQAWAFLWVPATETARQSLASDCPSASEAYSSQNRFLNTGVQQFDEGIRVLIPSLCVCVRVCVEQWRPKGNHPNDISILFVLLVWLRGGGERGEGGEDGGSNLFETLPDLQPRRLVAPGQSAGGQVRSEPAGNLKTSAIRSQVARCVFCFSQRVGQAPRFKNQRTQTKAAKTLRSTSKS